MVTLDQPDGYRRYMPGHTIEMDSSFAKPWYQGTSLNLGAGASGNFDLTISDVDHIYYIDSINISPLVYKELAAIVYVGSVAYVTAAGIGWLDIPLRENPSLMFLSGDTVRITATNNDSNTRTLYIKVIGTKLMRTSNFGHAPGAYFTVDDNTVSKGATVTFTDGSSGTITSYEWDFGDGSAKATTQNPTHVYTVAGTYYPRLKVRNQYGYDTYSNSTPITVS